MHVRIRQDLPDNQDIFAFPEEKQKVQSLSLRERPLLSDAQQFFTLGIIITDEKALEKITWINEN